MVWLSGCSEQLQNNETGNTEPVANCIASPNNGIVPLTVQFTGVGTDSDGTIVSYYWEFGDGTTSYIQNPSHTFQASGKYISTLTVTDDDGASDIHTVNIDVIDTDIPENAVITSFQELTVHLPKYIGKNVTIEGYIGYVMPGEGMTVGANIYDSESNPYYLIFLIIPGDIKIYTGMYRIFGTVEENPLGLGQPTINVISATAI